eukprot:2516520-Prymnesium_polylepis.1
MSRYDGSEQVLTWGRRVGWPCLGWPCGNPQTCRCPRRRFDSSTLTGTGGARILVMPPLRRLQ